MMLICKWIFSELYHHSWSFIRAELKWYYHELELCQGRITVPPSPQLPNYSPSPITSLSPQTFSFPTNFVSRDGGGGVR